MLFDLRGRGRRRTVQVIYATLAILLGGGLVLFGIGGGTNGGLFDAIGGNGSSSTSTDKVFQDRLASYQRQLQVAWQRLRTSCSRCPEPGRTRMPLLAALDRQSFRVQPRTKVQ